MSLTGLKSSFSCVAFLVGVSRESISLLFQHLEATVTPWLMVPFLHVQSQKRVLKSFSNNIIPKTSWVSYHSFLQIFMINSICNFYSARPRNWTYSQAPEMRTRTSSGPLFYGPQPPSSSKTAVSCSALAPQHMAQCLAGGKCLLNGL